MQAAAQTLCVMGLFVLYLFWFTMKKRRMRVKSRLRLERKKAGIKFYAAKFGIALSGQRCHHHGGPGGGGCHPQGHGGALGEPVLPLRPRCPQRRGAERGPRRGGPEPRLQVAGTVLHLLRQRGQQHGPAGRGPDPEVRQGHRGVRFRTPQRPETAGAVGGHGI